MKDCILYVVRHGESHTNRDGIVSGHFDTPLTELGKQQAKGAKKALQDVQFDEVYSSDLQRARDTAAIIFGGSVPVTHQLPDLRERNFGRFEQRPNAEFQELYKIFKQQEEQLTEQQRWEYKFADHNDIESNHELSTRFLAGLEQIAQANMGKTVLVGAHGGSIRVALIQLGFGTEATLPPGSFSNASYVQLRFDGQKFTVEKVTGVEPPPASGK